MFLGFLGEFNHFSLFVSQGQRLINNMVEPWVGHDCRGTPEKQMGTSDSWILKECEN
jgi:hypothetical protein